MLGIHLPLFFTLFMSDYNTASRTIGVTFFLSLSYFFLQLRLQHLHILEFFTSSGAMGGIDRAWYREQEWKMGLHVRCRCIMARYSIGT